MICGLNKITDLSGLAYVMSSFTKHTGGYDQAYKDAIDIAADLFAGGVVAFVPIAYGPAFQPKISNWHADTKYIDSHEFWMPICERFYDRCDYGIVAMTPGWETSEGIAVEFYALLRQKKPVYFYDPKAQHIYTLAEARKKFEAETKQLIETGVETRQSITLHEVSESYGDSVRQAMDGMVVQSALKKFGETLTVEAKPADLGPGGIRVN